MIIPESNSVNRGQGQGSNLEDGIPRCSRPPSLPPPSEKKRKKIVVCPLIKTKNASVGPLFGNSCKPLPPPPPWVKQHPTWVGPQYVSLCPLLVHTPSLGSQEYLFIPPPPSPVGRVTSHLGGAAICVIMSSSCTSSKSGMTGISEEKKSNFV